MGGKAMRTSLGLVTVLVLIIFSQCKYKGTELNYGKQLDKAKLVRIETDLGILNGKVLDYYNDKGFYPSSADELKPYLRGASLMGPAGKAYEYDPEAHIFKHGE